MFIWDDFLTFAERITQTPDTPGPRDATFRSATSRAYYAAFNRALIFAKKTMNYRKTDFMGVHEDLISFYAEKPEIEYREIATKLRAAFDNRVQADYRHQTNSKPDKLAEYNIKLSAEILKMLNTWR